MRVESKPKSVEIQQSKKNNIKRKRGVDINLSIEFSEIMTSMKKIGKNDNRQTENSIMNHKNASISSEYLVIDLPLREGNFPGGCFNGEQKDPRENIYTGMPETTDRDQWRTTLSSNPPKKNEHKESNLPLHEEGPHPCVDNDLNTTTTTDDNDVDDELKQSNNNNDLDHQQKEYDERKDSNLVFIRKYDPTFKFKVKDNTVCIQEQVKQLNEEFCDKCEQLANNYIVDTKKEDKQNLKIADEIRQLDISLKESNDTCLELKEVLKKTDSELYIDSGILFHSYRELRYQVSNYLNIQGCSTQERLDSMVQILIDHVVLCHPFESLRAIEELFKSSEHTSWIAHARNQIISILLKQEEIQVDTQLIIEIFERKHDLSLKSNESLENAIKIAHELSKYAIAPDTYFNGDLSLKGLSLLKAKEVDRTESLDKVRPTKVSKPPQLPPRRSSSIVEAEESKQYTIKREDKGLPSIDQKPTPPSHGYTYPPSPPRPPIDIQPGSSGREQGNHQLPMLDKSYQMEQWAKHSIETAKKTKKTKKTECCGWCQIYYSHRFFEDSKAAKAKCVKSSLCFFCRAVKKHKKCPTPIVRVECDQCLQLKQQMKNDRPF